VTQPDYYPHYPDLLYSLIDGKIVGQDYSKYNMNFVQFGSFTRSCQFEFSTFENADFSDADLRYTSFSHCVMKNANFSQANLLTTVFNNCYYMETVNFRPVILIMDASMSTALSGSSDAIWTSILGGVVLSWHGYKWGGEDCFNRARSWIKTYLSAEEQRWACQINYLEAVWVSYCRRHP
jgi:hypothetical protein